MSIKDNLFTPSGMMTTLIHDLVIVGLIASWVFFRVQVMGQPVGISTISEEAMNQKLHNK